MRISDWSSDVCSSDLAFEEAIVGLCNFDTDKDRDRAKEAVGIARLRLTTSTAKPNPDIVYVLEHEVDGDGREVIAIYKSHRSEERRVGKEWVSTCRSRWSPYH